MANDRRALLVATDRYIDPALTKLRAPAGDVQALGEVLEDPAIGAFDVRQLVNRPTDELKEEIEGFFDDGRREDLLLLYVSGHGVLSPSRRFYLATASTRLKRLRATAVDEAFLNDVMHHSRARSIAFVLDCCHSGAYERGFAPKGPSVVDVEHRFEGRGRVILTASTEQEYAFEEAETQLSEAGARYPRSLFTRYLVEGLQTGRADLNRDGDISIDELYDYVYDHVRSQSPHQTPGRSGSSRGHIVIAKSVYASALPADLAEMNERKADTSARRTASATPTQRGTRVSPAAARRAVERTTHRLERALADAQDTVRSLIQDVSQSTASAYIEIAKALTAVKRDTRVVNGALLMQIDRASAAGKKLTVAAGASTAKKPHARHSTGSTTDRTSTPNGARRDLARRTLRLERALTDAKEAVLALARYRGQAGAAYKQIGKVMSAMSRDVQKANKAALAEFDRLRAGVVDG